MTSYMGPYVGPYVNPYMGSYMYPHMGPYMNPYVPTLTRPPRSQGPQTVGDGDDLDELELCCVELMTFFT